VSYVQRLAATTAADKRRVLVTGGGTFLGDNIAAALLAEGAEVTLLVRAGNEERLGPLAQRVRWVTADVWDPASLRGRARGHVCVINTVGSMVADPAQGLSHNRLNFVSARNVVNMVISDGVPRAILLSAVRAPWINRQYLAAKRDAESYVRRVGVDATVVRAPLVFMRGQQRPLFFEILSALGSVPPLSWTRLGRIAPIPIDVMARAIARIALNPRPEKEIYYASDLRRLNSREEVRRGSIALPSLDPDGTASRPPLPRGYEDEAPFGWTPLDRR
jgi:uncharacterized protein YbjT (DUF2867 family)